MTSFKAAFIPVAPSPFTLQKSSSVTKRRNGYVTARETVHYSAPERLTNMTKFASDEILFFRPNSPNSDGVVNVVYAYPNEYSIGICSLGYQIVWALLNTISNVSVTRLFTDAMESIPRSTDIDLLGFSLSWELDYVGLFDQFKFLDIPRRAKNRTSMHPLIFGGGPVLTANPEPFSDFFDIILLGDGENTLPAFVRSYSKNRHLPREELLFELSKIDGVYIPELYDVKYESKVGPIKSISPANDGVEQTITKATEYIHG